MSIALVACPRREPAPLPVAPPDRVALFLTANMRGQLAPCGCSENMRGGLARAAHQLAQARKAGLVVFIDGGDSLFARSTISAEGVGQEERKARAMAQGLKAMGVALRAPGELDLARGEPFLRGLDLPDLPPGTWRFLELPGRAIAVLSANDSATASSLAQSAREQGAEFVLLLAHQAMDEALKTASHPRLGADLIVATHARDEASSESNRLVNGSIPVVSVQSKGRSLVRADLSFLGRREHRFRLQALPEDIEREAQLLDQRIDILRRQVNEPSLGAEALRLRQEKIFELIERRNGLARASAEAPTGTNTYSVRFVPLESTLPADPAVRELVAAYDRDVGRINLEWARAHGRDCPAPEKGQAAFVGSATCRECHEEAFAVWEKSKHAQAYRTLEELGKNHHLDCVSCHVTGSKRPGGVCRVDRVAGRGEVGCESCHGPGSLHLEDPVADNVIGKNVADHCTSCHDPENSPHFDFERYRAEILGPGHGQLTAPSKASRR